MKNINLFSQILQEIPKGTFRTLAQKCKVINTQNLSKTGPSGKYDVCHLGHANSVCDIVGKASQYKREYQSFRSKEGPCKSSPSYMNKHRNAELVRDYSF